MLAHEFRAMRTLRRERRRALADLALPRTGGSAVATEAIAWAPRMPGARDRSSVGHMTLQHDPPTLRESVDDLTARLARVTAAATTLRKLAPQITNGVPPVSLITVTEELERDLARTS